jgi:hypothetical protein
MKKSLTADPSAPKPKSKKYRRGFLAYLAGGSGLVRLRSKMTKIGKAPSSDVVIKGLTVGKTAATINRTADGYLLSYAGGFARPRVNKQKIRNEPVILKESDIIEIGSTKMQFIIKAVRK